MLCCIAIHIKNTDKHDFRRNKKPRRQHNINHQTTSNHQTDQEMQPSRSNTTKRELPTQAIRQFITEAEKDDRVTIVWAEHTRHDTYQSKAIVVEKPSESQLILSIEQYNVTTIFPQPEIHYFKLSNTKKRPRPLQQEDPIPTDKCDSDDHDSRQINSRVRNRRIHQRASKVTQPQPFSNEHASLNLHQPRRGLMINQQDIGPTSATIERCRKAAQTNDSTCRVCNETLKGCDKLAYDSDSETNTLRSVTHFMCNEDIGRIEQLQKTIASKHNITDINEQHDFVINFMSQSCPWFRKSARTQGKSMGTDMKCSWKKTSQLNIVQQNGKHPIKSLHVLYLWEKTQKRRCRLCHIPIDCPHADTIAKHTNIVSQRLIAPGSRTTRGEEKRRRGVLDINQGMIHKSGTRISSELRSILCTKCKDAISALERTSIHEDITRTHALRHGERTMRRTAHARKCAEKFSRCIALSNSCVVIE